MRARALRPLLLSAVLGLNLALASTAAASSSVSVARYNGVVDINVTVDPDAATGGTPDTVFTGTIDGMVTVVSPGGLSVIQGQADCTAVDANTATCAAGDHLLVGTGGAGGAVVDLSGLPQRSGLGGPWGGPFRNGYPSDAVAEFLQPYVTVHGSAGDDTVIGGSAAAVYELGAGHDTVIGGPGDELVRATAGDGDDTLGLAGGFDIVSYAASTAAVQGSIGDGPTTVSTGGATDDISGAEAIVGGSGNDVLALTGRAGDRGTLVGNAGDDVLTGGDGPDYLVGGGGSDTLTGNGGDDRLLGYGTGGLLDTSDDASRDSVDGGSGDDELVIGGRTDPLGPHNRDHTPACGPGHDVLRADRDFDDGVGPHSWPADCEYLAPQLFGVSYDGLLEVGQTLTVHDQGAGDGSPIFGYGKSTWTICHRGVIMCESRVTPSAALTLEPGDLGAFIMSATTTLLDPLSGDPRWIVYRSSPNYFPRAAFGGTEDQGRIRAAGDHCVQQPPPPFSVEIPEQPGCGGYPVATPTPTPTPTPSPTTAPRSTPAPTPPAVLDGKKAATSVLAALGKKRASLAALGRPVKVVIRGPSGSAVRVTLSAVRGKKQTLLSRAAGVTDRAGAVRLTLKPTKAGKKAAKAKKAVTVVGAVTATAPGGKPVTTTAKVRVGP